MIALAVLAAALPLSDLDVEEDIQQRIDAAAEKGGGRVILEAGVHRAGTIYLRSNVELHLERGAVLMGSANWRDYDDVDDPRIGKTPERLKKAFLAAIGCTNVVLSGEGTIDGQGVRFYDTKVRDGAMFGKPPHPRPRMAEFVACRDVRIEGLTFKDSPGWTCWLRNCRNVTCTRLKIHGDQRMVNNDGLHFDGCRHVRVSDCDIQTGDDCIIMRANRLLGGESVCEDMVVENCRLDSNCQAVRLGCPSDDTIRNGTFRNLKITGNNGIASIHPNRYLQPGCEGYCKMEDLLFENCEIDVRGSALLFTVDPGLRLRRFGGVTFRNLKMRRGSKVVLDGTADSPLTGVVFDACGDLAGSVPFVRKPSDSWEADGESEGGAGKLLALHLDFNTLQLTKETVRRLIRRAAQDGYNAILWEIENKVKWESCPEVAAPDAFAKDEFRELLAEARELGLEPIPLMQTFGHAEYVLVHDTYRQLREVPERKECYCPSNPETRRFLKRFLHEYLELFGPDVKRFHLGGDEAHQFGSCAKCKGRNRIDLYVEHLDAVAEELRARQIRPAVWHDMLGRFDRECGAFARLPRDFAVYWWDYCADSVTKSTNLVAALAREAAAGREIVGCPSLQSFVDDPFLVRYGEHRANVSAVADVCRKNNFAGLCVTSWSCHSGLKTLQLPLIDFAALEARRPAAEANWRTAVRTHYGTWPVAALDDLTAWDFGILGIDGRYSGCKDAALPPVDKIEAGTKNPETRNRYADNCRKLLAKAEKGLAALKAAPGERTPLAELALEAGELKLAFLRGNLGRLTGQDIGEMPIGRVRAFYEREQPPETAWRSTCRAFLPIVGKGLHEF